MPITAVFPAITFPHRGVEAKDVFVATQETAQDLLSGSLTSALNTFKTEANTLETNVNSKEASATASALSASNSALSAQGSANYQGAWTSKGYSVGQTVSDLNGLRWLCKTTHTTAQVISEGVYWTIAIPYLGAIGNINSPLLYLPLKNSLVMKEGVGSVTFTRSTTATYIDRYGILKTAAIDEARFEKQGYLNEGASVNLATYSEEMLNASYAVNSGMTKDVSATYTDPSGNTTAVGFTPAVGATSYVGKSITPTSTGIHTLSVFIKKFGNLDSFGLLVSDAWFTETTSPNITYTFSNNTIAVTDPYANITGYGSELLSNGWVRLWLSCEIDSAVAGAVQFRNNVLTLDGVNDKFSIWGAQLEALPFATSYIKSLGVTQGSRTSDALNISANGNYGLPSSEKTIMIDFDILGHYPTNQVLFDLTSSSQFNRILSSAGTNNQTIVYYSGAARQFAASPILSNTKKRIAFVVGGGLTSINVRYMDGIAYASIADTIAADVAPTTLYIGKNNSVTTQNHYGHITNVRIYDKALNPMEVALA